MHKPASEKTPSEHSGDTWVGAVLVLSGIFALVETFLIGLTIDTKTILHYTIHMMQGGMYDRWMPANLPLSMWIYTLSAAAVLKLHVPPVLAMHVYGLAWCLISLWMLHRALMFHGIEQSEQRRWLSMSACALFIAPSLLSVYSDREHLLFVFITPWLVQMWLQRKPIMSTILLAAIGFCIKPYNLAIFACVLLTSGQEGASWKQRIFSPSSWIVGSFALVYILIIGLFYPLYAQKILPLSSITYPIYYNDWLLLIERFAEVVLPTYIFLKVARLPTPLFKNFCGFLIGCTIVFSLNGRWIYPLYILAYPFSFSILFALHAHAGEKISVRDAPLYFIASIILFICILQTTSEIEYTKSDGYAYNYFHMPKAQLSDMRTAAGDQFILIAINPWASVIAGTGEAPYSRFAYDDTIWPLAWISQYPDDPRGPHLWQTGVSEPIVRAMKDYPHATILEDESPNQRHLGFGFNVFTYIQGDPMIAKALASYDRVQVIDYCTPSKQWGCRYGVWRRRDL